MKGTPLLVALWVVAFCGFYIGWRAATAASRVQQTPAVSVAPAGSVAPQQQRVTSPLQRHQSSTAIPPGFEIEYLPPPATVTAPQYSDAPPGFVPVGVSPAQVTTASPRREIPPPPPGFTLDPPAGYRREIFDEIPPEPAPANVQSRENESRIVPSASAIVTPPAITQQPVYAAPRYTTPTYSTPRFVKSNNGNTYTQAYTDAYYRDYYRQAYGNYYVQPQPLGEPQYVEGYVRSSTGTYVPGHYRTKADSTIRNNYSTSGNVNPYTGQRGSRRR